MQHRSVNWQTLFMGCLTAKDYLSSGQTEKILTDASRSDVYSAVIIREICWGEHGESLRKGGKAMIRALEEGDMEKAEDIRLQWAQLCGKSVQYLETVKDRFQKEKQVLIWDNRMIESRLAVAQQLNETASDHGKSSRGSL